MFTTFDYSSTLVTSTDNEFVVSGSLVFPNGQPAAGVTVTMEVQWTDPFLGPMNETHEQVTGSGGTFNFDSPAYNLILPNDANVNFLLRYYHYDPNLSLSLADLIWSWGTDTWTESLY